MLHTSQTSDADTLSYGDNSQPNAADLVELVFTQNELDKNNLLLFRKIQDMITLVCTGSLEDLEAAVGPSWRQQRRLLFDRYSVERQSPDNINFLRSCGQRMQACHSTNHMGSCVQM